MVALGNDPMVKHKAPPRGVRINRNQTVTYAYASAGEASTQFISKRAEKIRDVYPSAGKFRDERMRSARHHQSVEEHLIELSRVMLLSEPSKLIYCMLCARLRATVIRRGAGAWPP